MDLQQLTADVEHVSEGYAARFGIARDDAWFLLKLHEEVGELTQAHLMRSGLARPKGHTREQLDAAFRDELADVVCQALLLAHHHGIDVEQAIRDKWLVWSESS